MTASPGTVKTLSAIDHIGCPRIKMHIDSHFAGVQHCCRKHPSPPRSCTFQYEREDFDKVFPVLTMSVFWRRVCGTLGSALPVSRR